ncbi:MAG: pyrimidine-nucleoside phosphorylase [Bacillota bacterium]|jgi:pyrimidine-nucleoside phosphorylase
MNMYDLINKKKNGMELSKEEIFFWVQGLTEERIPDYQSSALLMAIYFQGLTLQETVHLTAAMVKSGDTVDLSGIPGIKGDKHSTGGVGDKTTLVLAPLLASLGIIVAKMSGRGLGHTGGTLDKLESIPGLRIDLSKEEFMENVKSIGLAVVGQTEKLVPADKKLYALRDVTATVDSVPLIAASIMSKKIAAGGDFIILDVKYGSGAFMKTREEAENLARMMVGIGSNMGKKTAAVLTSMDQPLGNAVGNALEVKEAISVLKGKGPQDVRDLCLRLAGVALCLAGKASHFREGEKLAELHLDNGSALRKFREMIVAQKGNPQVLDHEELLPQVPFRLSLISDQNGYISAMDTEGIGLAVMKLGAGREKKEDMIDPGVGVVFYKKTGDRVKKGETLAMIHAHDENRAEEIRNMLRGCLHYGKDKKDPQPLIYPQVLSQA